MMTKYKASHIAVAILSIPFAIAGAAIYLIYCGGLVGWRLAELQMEELGRHW